MQKLLIVDSHCLFADGVRFLIEYSTEHHVVGVLHTGKEVIPFLIQHEVDLLLLDIDLPDMTGLELTRTVRTFYPATQVLALTTFTNTQSINLTIEAGALGYCPKQAGRNELFAAIRSVGAGHLYLPPSLIQQLRKPATEKATQDLTDRETEVIQLIVNGHTTKTIADKLFLSTRTVETHRKNIYRKLRIHTNIELARYAQVNKII
ncbi:response regulator [Spirosoma panaciterrae]|uniref:response regulator n=1 Tax=Spirosoma panaciterrae TaxID=496058 RepID=UPI000366F6DC|nr:response regulator transcription factor [Spirosoma panaciterrae]